MSTASGNLKVTGDFVATLISYAGLPADALACVLAGFSEVLPLTRRERRKLDLVIDEHLIWARIGGQAALALAAARRQGLL